MPRKRTVQTPGAAPVADTETTQAQVAADIGANDQGETDTDPAPAADSAPVAATPAKPARIEARETPDPSTLTAAVLTERGWLCPSPKAAN